MNRNQMRVTSAREGQPDLIAGPEKHTQKASVCGDRLIGVQRSPAQL